MRQVFLKASFDLGWGSAAYRVSLDGEGSTGYLVGLPDSAKLVVPLAGTFRNVSLWSPGTHPNYTVTLLVNGIATALTCALTATQSTAQDVTHAVPVVAGDDVCLGVAVSPIGSGVGYPLAVSVEFEGAQQFYGIRPRNGAHDVDTYHTGGALGNGRWQVGGLVTQLSNTYSICTTAGTATGLRLKTYAGAPGTGQWTGYLIKNQVLQDGAGATVNTACVLTGAETQATSTFALPLAIGDHVDLALKRTGSAAPFALSQVAMSVLVTPTDATTFMSCGGSTNANSLTAVEWRWVQSEQLNTTNEAVAQCPVGPRGITLTGLRAECAAPGAGRSVTYTLRKNGVDTAATVTVANTASAAAISGLSIALADGDLLSLEAVPVNTPLLGNGMWWGLSLQAPVSAPPAYTVDTRAIRRLRRAPHVSQEHVRLFYRAFELDLERGVGLATGQGSDPLVMLRLSRDGGHTWGEPIELHAGQLGEYTRRAIARRLGTARDVVFEVTVSDPVAWSLVGAWLDLEAGTS